MTRVDFYLHSAISISHLGAISMYIFRMSSRCRRYVVMQILVSATQHVITGYQDSVKTRTEQHCRSIAPSVP